MSNLKTRSVALATVLLSSAFICTAADEASPVAEEFACYARDIAESSLPKEDKDGLLAALKGCTGRTGAFSDDEIEQAKKILKRVLTKANPYKTALEILLTPTPTAPRVLDEMGVYKDYRDRYLPPGCHGSEGKSPCGTPEAPALTPR